MRAVAMLGVVVMNYHGYLINRGAVRDGGWAYDLFDLQTGPLSTRFAATFVLTAGVGVTLLTRGAIGDHQRTTERRWLLLRRGLLLFAFGLGLDYIWPGTILPYYGAMFVCAAAIFTWRTRWIVAVGVGAALAGAAIRWWRLEAELDGHDTSWLTRPGANSPRGLMFDTFVNGTHPLFPWLAFLCAGIVVGRTMQRSDWRVITAVLGAGLYISASLVTAAASGDRALVLLSDDPFQRGVVYTASALGTSLVAFAAITAVADRYSESPVIEALRLAGQMSLSIYITHVLVFNLVVDWLDIVQPGGLGSSLLFAVVVWAGATTAAVATYRRYGQGPAEYVYRRLTA